MSYFEDFEEDLIGNDMIDDGYYYDNKICMLELLTDKWKTKEGKYVKPINMGTNHIINTLNLILKRM